MAEVRLMAAGPEVGAMATSNGRILLIWMTEGDFERELCDVDEASGAWSGAGGLEESGG
jgi:hypothetical protein